jgi:phosphonate transport system substrate-binding protein
MRRLLLTLAAAALALAGCGRTERLVIEVVTEDQAPLRLGVPLAEDPARVRAQYEPLTVYLAKRLGRSVDLVVSPTYKSVGWLLEQGKIELAWLSGVAFTRVSRAYPAVALARAVRRGTTTYQGVLVVPAGSPARTVADLRGKRLAYVDPASGSGFLAANQMLLDAGLSPGADLAECGFTYGHLESLKLLASGRYDAAAVFDRALEVYAGAIDTSKFRVLALSSPLANDVVACSPNLDATLRERIRKLLLEMKETPDGKKGLAEMSTYGSLDGYVEVK